MRVLFATPHTYLPQGTGGMEVNTHALGLALIGTGAQVAVYCGFDDGRWRDLSRRAIHKALGRTLLADSRCGYPVFRAKYPTESAAEAIATTRPDVVVVQGWDAHLLAKPFVRAGIPTVIYVHNAQHFTYDEELRRSDRLYFVANSPFTASLHPDKTVVRTFPPLIEPDAYRVESSRESVLFVNPIRKKGLDIALSLARRRPDAPFDFFEAWALGAEERAEARRLTAGLPNVRWHGAVTDMRLAYGRARLVLSPSAMETWGRTASEGHISGIPTLSSDRGALPHAVGPGGICVPFDGSESRWVDAFSQIWDDAVAYDRYSQAALEYSRREELHAPGIAAAFGAFLHSVVRGVSPG